MLDLNDYTSDNGDRAKKFHSSGHARLGQDAAIGATSSQTFQQRIDLEKKQRRTIDGYGSSTLGARRGEVKAKRYEPPTDGRQGAEQGGRMDYGFSAGSSSGRPGSRNSTVAGQSPSATIGVRPQSTFREPPSRGFTPYA